MTFTDTDVEAWHKFKRTKCARELFTSDTRDLFRVFMAGRGARVTFVTADKFINGKELKGRTT